MAEGVASAATGAVVADPVYDDPAAEPAADPQQAPKGWTWTRASKRWVPRSRAPSGQQQVPPAAPPPEQPEQKTGFPWMRKRDTPAGAEQQDNGPDGGSTRDRDPDPSWAGDDRPPPSGLWDPSKVSGEVQDDIAGLLALFYSIPADFLITIDPYCFGALNENLEATIDATVPIICRSRTAVEFVTGAGGLMLWIKLLATLKPFFVAVWQHHVIHAVALERETDPDTGQETGQLVAVKQDFSAY